MTDAQISDLTAVALLLGAGLVLGLLGRSRFDWRWLLVAVALVVVNNLLLSRGYGLIPDWAGGERNWTGKVLALAGTLVIASLPMFGWRRSGLTLAQRPGSLRPAIPVALLYCAFFLAIALAFPSDPPSGEEVAFQLTMPGLEEELFYRGILLLALDQAFRSRVRFLGVDWGWGAVLSCFAFGLAHAFGYSDGAFWFDPMTMALTAVPSFIAVWLRYRTGSLLLPVLLHNFGNSIGLLVR
jgi:membrane protease YdiL (CAAX protease family)